MKPKPIRLTSSPPIADKPSPLLNPLSFTPLPRAHVCQHCFNLCIPGQIYCSACIHEMTFYCLPAVEQTRQKPIKSKQLLSIRRVLRVFQSEDFLYYSSVLLLCLILFMSYLLTISAFAYR